MDNIADIFSHGFDKLPGSSYFKSLAENIPHKIIFVDSENFCIQYANHYQGTELYKSVMGQKIEDFILPDHKERFMDMLHSVKKTLKPVSIEMKGVSLVNGKGTAWYKTYVNPLVDESQVLYGFLMVTEDITDRKENELEIINKNEKIKAILNNTNDIICSIDLDYNLTEFNVVFAGMVKAGYGVDLQIGLPILNFIDPRTHDKLRGLYQRVAKGEIINDIESFNTSKGVMYNETSYHPIYDFNHQIIGISIFSKNITNRKLNEEKIQAALKEKEILLAEIHHRIKNNLAIVSGMLQLQEMHISNPEAKEALRLSRNRIKSTALVHELLYKNDSFHQIYLHDYINQLFQNLRPDNRKRIETNGDTVALNIDKALPLGLLMNELMTNSIKHSYRMNDEEDKIAITFSLDTPHNCLNIEYCDCKGIFPDHIDFYNPTTTGLLLIHTFVQQLEGTIKLTEKKPPRYFISLPLS